MATLYRASARTLDDRVLLRLIRSRVFAADPDEVAVVDITAAGELPTLVCTEAVRAPHGVHIGDELLHISGGLRLPLHPVQWHLLRGAIDEHDQIK